MADAPKVILYVEDNPDDQVLAYMAFRRSCPDLEIRIVGSVQEGIDYLAGQDGFADREQFPLPTLLLLDFSIEPDIGPDLLRWLRIQPEFEDLPVVVFSGTQTEGRIREAYGAGAAVFLEKPCRYDQLVVMFQAMDECLKLSPVSFEPLRALPQYRSPEAAASGG